MRVSLSLLFILTVVIVVLIRVRHKHEGLTIMEFVLCSLWGFLLHESSFAPMVNSFLQAFANALRR